jgi:hypothetical protein
MSIPELPSVMLSLLKLAADQREHAIHDAIDSLAKQFQLSEQEREELLPSRASTIGNGWDMPIQLYPAINFLPMASLPDRSESTVPSHTLHPCSQTPDDPTTTARFSLQPEQR